MALLCPYCITGWLLAQFATALVVRAKARTHLIIDVASLAAHSIRFAAFTKTLFVGESVGVLGALEAGLRRRGRGRSWSWSWSWFGVTTVFAVIDLVT